MKKYTCPLCQTVLSKEQWERVYHIEEERQRKQREFELKLRKQCDKLRGQLAEARERFELEKKAWREGQRLKIREAIQKGKEKEMRRADRLSAQLAGALRAINEKESQIGDLKEQLKKGTTPQVEGLLDEKKFCALLEETFRADRIEHTGKGGDVLHHVMLNGRPVGTIVYECKRVPKVLPAHVLQTRRAVEKRHASYGVLVTAGAKRGRFGFWSERGIFVVHPLGATSFAGVLRDSIIEINRMQLTRKERDIAAKRVFDYLSGHEFRNNMHSILECALELRDMVSKEYRTHVSIWKKRLEHYKSIYGSASTVRSSLHRILETRKQLPASLKALPPVEKWAQIGLTF